MAEEILQIIPAPQGTIAVFKESLNKRWEVWARRVYVFGLVKHIENNNEEWKSIEPFICEPTNSIGLENALADDCFDKISFLKDVSDEALKEFGEEQSRIWTEELLKSQLN